MSSIRRYKILVSFCLAAPLFFLVGSGWAANYYVAANATGASDSNNGLSATFVSGTNGPWKTLGKAAGVAAAGDTVNVYNGTYNETVKPVNSGNSASPIRFLAASGQSPVVSSFWLVNLQWVEVSGFKITGPKTYPSNWADMPAIVMDDPSIVIDAAESWTTRQAKVNAKYATYLALLDSFGSPGTKGVYLSNSSHITIRNNNISLQTRGIQVSDSSSFLTISNNNVHHCLEGIYFWASTNDPVSGTDADVSSNTCSQNLDTAIAPRNNAARVRLVGNQCEYEGLHHLSFENGTLDSSAVGNTLRYGGFYSETMSGPGSSGINVHSAGTGIVIEKNFVSYQMDLTMVDGNGVIGDGTNPMLIRNNVFYRNTGSGINMTNSPGQTIINNTCVENGYQTTSTKQGAGIRVSQTIDTGNVIMNNIVANNHTAQIFLRDPVNQTAVDYNLYYSSSSGVLMRASNDTSKLYYSLGVIHSSTTWEDHGLQGDPQFVQPSTPNYHLQSASPAINHADGTRAPADDFDGNTRKSPPDMGAYEYMGAATPQAPLAPRNFRQR